MAKGHMCLVGGHVTLGHMTHGTYPRGTYLTRSGWRSHPGWVLSVVHCRAYGSGAIEGPIGGTD